MSGPEPFDRYTPTAKYVLAHMLQVARHVGSVVVGSQHLLHAITLVRHARAARILLRYGIEQSKVLAFVQFMDTGKPEDGGPAPVDGEAYRFSKQLERALGVARAHATELGAADVDVDHLALALLDDLSSIAYQAVVSLGGSPDGARDQLLGELRRPTTETDKATDPVSVAKPRARRDPRPAGVPAGRAESAPAAAALVDLIEQARTDRLDRVIGREKELKRVMQILMRRTKNNPVLLGEPGVGKTAIVEGLAQAIAAGVVPAPLRGAGVYALDVSALVAGTKYRGEFEEKVRRLIEELRAKKDAILFIDELHTVVGAGRSEGALDVANLLKPHLAKGELRCIGSTTWHEYRKYIERDPALERRFQPVSVEEPDETETRAILDGVRSLYEGYHHVTIESSALDAAVRLSALYVQGRRQPDKAIDLLDEACARARLAAPDPTETIKDRLRALYEDMATSVSDPVQVGELRRQEEELVRAKERVEADPPRPVVDASGVAAVVAEWTSIPAGELSSDERARLRALETALHARIVGQDQAVSELARAVRRGRLGVGDADRPVGSFLFVGPSGCGKTALARALAQALFGGDDALVKLDMSEYSEKHTVSRLIGSPPGYVGHDDGGQLTEALRRHPHCVLLFDEIEEAAEEVLGLLLQLLEDASVTDGKGVKVSARHAVVILTSNLGTREAAAASERGSLGFRNEATSTAERERDRARMVERAVRRLPPKLLGRIETTIAFAPLGSEHVQAIIDLELGRLSTRLQRTQHLAVSIGPALRARLAADGFDPQRGARPLRRAITALVEDPISQALVDERLSGASEVRVDLDAAGAPIASAQLPPAEVVPA